MLRMDRPRTCAVQSSSDRLGTKQASGRCGTQNPSLLSWWQRALEENESTRNLTSVHCNMWTLQDDGVQSTRPIIFQAQVVDLNHRQSSSSRKQRCALSANNIRTESLCTEIVQWSGICTAQAHPQTRQTRSGSCNTDNVLYLQT